MKLDRITLEILVPFIVVICEQHKDNEKVLEKLVEIIESPAVQELEALYRGQQEK